MAAASVLWGWGWSGLDCVVEAQASARSDKKVNLARQQDIYLWKLNTPKFRGGDWTRSHITYTLM